MAEPMDVATGEDGAAGVVESANAGGDGHKLWRQQIPFTPNYFPVPSLWRSLAKIIDQSKSSHSEGVIGIRVMVAHSAAPKIASRLACASAMHTNRSLSHTALHVRALNRGLAKGMRAAPEPETRRRRRCSRRAQETTGR